MTKIVSVLSGKGGTGKTTVSINLSLALRNLSYKVVLVDGNVTMPHVSTYLGINSYKYCLNDFLSGKDFDKEALVNYNGIKILVSSPALEDLANVDLRKMKKIVENIKNVERPDFIIIDGPPGLGKEAITIMEVSDEILIVAQPFEQHLIDAVKIKEVAQSLKKNKIGLILNNGFWIPTKKIEEIEKFVGVKVVGFVPHHRSFMFSLLNKTPIVEISPNSLLSEFFVKLASNISGDEHKESWKFKIYKKINDFVSSL